MHLGDTQQAARRHAQCWRPPSARFCAPLARGSSPPDSEAVQAGVGALGDAALPGEEAVPGGKRLRWVSIGTVMQANPAGSGAAGWVRHSTLNSVPMRAGAVRRSAASCSARRAGPAAPRPGASHPLPPGPGCCRKTPCGDRPPGGGTCAFLGRRCARAAKSDVRGQVRAARIGQGVGGPGRGAGPAGCRRAACVRCHNPRISAAPPCADQARGQRRGPGQPCFADLHHRGQAAASRGGGSARDAPRSRRSRRGVPPSHPGGGRTGGSAGRRGTRWR